jgi:hypothetical protein
MKSLGQRNLKLLGRQADSSIPIVQGYNKQLTQWLNTKQNGEKAQKSTVLIKDTNKKISF